MATCSSCKAEIIWVTSSASGRWIPLDAQPVAKADGNVSLDVRGGKRVAVGGPKGSGNYVSHFATCPNSTHHRIAQSPPSASDKARPDQSPGPDAEAVDVAKPEQLQLGDLTK